MCAAVITSIVSKMAQVHGLQAQRRGSGLHVCVWEKPLQLHAHPFYDVLLAAQACQAVTPGQTGSTFAALIQYVGWVEPTMVVCENVEGLLKRNREADPAIVMVKDPVSVEIRSGKTDPVQFKGNFKQGAFCL